ncbi:hypothetical protein H0H93_012202 [Arthromyces matolae]|nr:hypothetical protein H0H93_012202 [Arthromyces matolae]
METPYMKLWDAPNADIFMKIFLDCIDCHYQVYMQNKVLLQGISENNLMFKCGTDGHTKGILNDWDIASNDVDKLICRSQPRFSHRILSAIPFMARDLLVDGDPSPPHLYRHDLESFLYILVWAALNREFGADRPRTRGTIDPLIAHWDVSSLESAQIGKGCFITTYYTTKTKILERVQAKNSFLAPFVDALWALFCHAHLDHGTRSMKNSLEDWDDATLGGHITFENFMKAIGREPR